MGIFNSSSKAKKETNSVNWIPLTSMEQLNQIKEFSKSETILLFKHSTRCGISRMVMKRFEKMFDETMKNTKVYYLDLLNYREVSNEVSHTFQVMHESPQLLVIKNEIAIFYASHYDITLVDFQKYL